ncbi:MAG: ATP-dependent Clp protease proteolytic subunit 1 [Chlamydiia bacterium]|nr:ATP-dependent Clp protease proteolytic subunit 1 [Chlamydiia bacterium]MCH9618525.1 ATP-dependent Clp protease proteolytic subunit 1 [Chlamydiia bacterium]
MLYQSEAIMSQNKVEEKKEQKDQGSVEGKIEDMLIAERKIFLSSQVDDKSAKEIIRKVWYLEHTAPGKPILFIINSPGGSVDSGFAIWDQMKMITSPVYTLVTGLAASMGSILSLVAGKGKRFATKNARIMIHQPLIGGVIQGQATDLEIQAKEIIKTREALIDIYEQETGKERSQIEKALDRDTWMTAEEAKAFGLLDGIVDSYKDINMV